MRIPLKTINALALSAVAAISCNAEVIATSHSRLRGKRVRGASSTITSVSASRPQLQQYDNISEHRFLKVREGEPTSSNRDDPNKREGENARVRDRKNRMPKLGLHRHMTTSPPESLVSETITDVLPVTGERDRKNGAKLTLKNIHERMREKKNDPKVLVAAMTPTEAPTVVQTAAPTPDATAAPTPSPTSLPTLPPTNKPTQYPTWTFEVPAPEIVAEAQFVCEYCAGGCFDDTAVVKFRQGSSATCAKIREVSPSLTQTQCRIERKIIEEICCCDGIATRREEDENEAIIPECRFCEGMEYADTPIINFSSGNDSVSCGGFMDLVRSGIPAQFCSAERASIEEACCQPLPVEEVEETGSLPSGEELIDFLTPEETIVEEADTEYMVEYDDFLDTEGNFTEIIFPEPENEVDPADSGLPATPATIKEGGTRQQRPLGSVDRSRRPLVTVAEGTTTSRIVDEDTSGSRQPLYDPNDFRDRDRTTGRLGEASRNEERGSSATTTSSTLAGTQQQSSSSRIDPLYSAEMTRDRGRVAEPGTHRNPVKRGVD